MGSSTAAKAKFIYIADRKVYGCCTTASRVLLQWRCQGPGRGERCNPIYIASDTGHADIVQVLLTAGAAKDQAEETGVTPLCVASVRGDVGIVQALLIAGAAKDQARETGATPLYHAADTGHIAIVQALLTAGAAKDQAKKEVQRHFALKKTCGH